MRAFLDISPLARLTLYKNLLIGQETELSTIRINGLSALSGLNLEKNLRAFSRDIALARLTLLTFSVLEKISEELPERVVESVCEGAELLSLCDIQIVTEGYSKIENQNEKDEKDQPLSSDGNPNDNEPNSLTPFTALN